ncbi:glycosyltransferase [Bacteroides timonensis]|uniref:glycosyltransferase n=1 Tax=Bacteroides timonensis TaxID=1470345 RepID=UPI0004B15BA3|nr:glycosyltransferase [Bacteroides timonensis]
MADFIITALQTWEFSIGSNAKDIALELSRQHRVLFINTPVPSRHSHSKLRTIQENLWVLDCNFTILPVNKLPDGFLFDFANRFNNKLIFHAVNQAAKQLGFQNIIHFCDNDIYRSFYARTYLHASLYIYYRRDNLHAVPYWKRHIRRLEPALIQKSDLVMCNSEELAEYVRSYLPTTQVHNVGQGVDLSAYHADANYVLPKEYLSLPHPIIGYTGVIYSLRLDIELLYKIALDCPQYTFIFIGPEDEVFQNHRIHNLPNTHFTGIRPPEQMPAYIRFMDVCMNPQIVNEVTIGNYPRKIDEYLAMGKPVVATRTRTMEFFKDYVYLCSSVDEYKRAIANALKTDSPTLQKRRIIFSQTHTWEYGVRRILKIIEDYDIARNKR